MSLYVLHVQTGNELKIHRELRRQKLEAYVPEENALLRKDGKWQEVRRILMPGYVFISLELSAQLYYKVRAVPGVIRFLGSPPEPVSEQEQQHMEWLLNDGEVIEPSEGIIKNGRVVITSGKLAGMEGQILHFNRRQKRATALVSIFGKRHEVTLSVRFK